MQHIILFVTQSDSSTMNRQDLCVNDAFKKKVRFSVLNDIRRTDHTCNKCLDF